MSDSKSQSVPLVRIIVPAVMLLVGLLLFRSLMLSKPAAPPIPPAGTSGASTPGTTMPATGGVTAGETDEAADATGAGAGSGSGDQAATERPVEPAAAGAANGAATEGDAAGAKRSVSGASTRSTGLRAEILIGAGAAFGPIGSLDDPTTKIVEGEFELWVEFSELGAGIESIKLSRFFRTTKRIEHDVVQRRYYPAGADVNGVAPFAALGVEVNGELVNLAYDPSGVGRVWDATGPGAFVAHVVDGEGTRVARVTREYTLTPGSFDLVLRQRFENLTNAPMKVVWRQYGPVDLPAEGAGYTGDKRRTRFGYLLSASADPAQQWVQGSRYLLERADVLGKPEVNGAWGRKALWPNARSAKDGYSLVWAGMTNRYFAVLAHPLVDPSAAKSDKVFRMASVVERYVLPGAHLGGGVPVPSAGVRGTPTDVVMVLGLISQEMSVDGGGAADLSMGVYAGPLSKDVITGAAGSATRDTKADLLTAVGLDRVVVFNLGGWCMACTFQPVARFLRAFLGLLAHHVVFDWSLSILLLVVCVRTLLHPVTKFSQVRMARFGKQMQALAPKQKAIQEKFKGDPVKMRAEMQKLMREENINFAGALGCLPAFLQTPIWIALYAMLYFTFELRHEPAFFGVFQAITGGSWSFMRDLAEPDMFIPFGRSIHVPLLSSMLGGIEGLHVLPLLLGAVFYVQQKYLMPPPANQTPEQMQQMKMMKIITVVMFPLFMYNAPCGLTLYFICNSVLGILESRYIRRHTEKLDAIAAERAKERGVVRPGRTADKAGGRGGFMDRIRQAVEERRVMLEQRGKPASPRAGGAYGTRGGSGPKKRRG